jgi:phosphoenolpyruvate phosphomutase
MPNQDTAKPPLRIYCCPKSSNAKALFTGTEHQLVERPADADLLWIRSEPEHAFPFLQAHQSINHIPGEMGLCNKGLLTLNLRNHSAVSPDVDTSFYPESFCLFANRTKNEAIVKLQDPAYRNVPWLLKPGNNSRGRGIVIYDDPEKIDIALRRESGKFTDQEILQRYITNPLLLNGRKSELRIYWVILSTEPLVAFLYDTGTVRLTSKEFVLDNFDDKAIHLTNTFQQKQQESYDPSQPLKWSFEDLDAYLVTQGKTSCSSFTRDILLPKLQSHLSIILDATREELNKGLPKQGHCFALLGADVILDDNLNVFISEIQEGPGLSFDDHIKEKLIPAMLSDLVDLIRDSKLNQVSDCPLPARPQSRFLPITSTDSAGQPVSMVTASLNNQNSESNRKPFSLRNALESDRVTYTMEAHDGLSAKIASDAGFEALWASGFSISTALGMRDCNEMSASDLVYAVERMRNVTKVPILVDIDEGYGSKNSASKLARRLENIGAAGVCLEDKCFPKRNSFVGGPQTLAEIHEMTDKIRAIKNELVTEDFVVVARLEGFISGCSIFEVLQRAKAYQEAGADALLIHSKKSTDAEIRLFCQHWPKSLPLIIVPTTYSDFDQSWLADAGIRMVIWANQSVRASAHAMMETCAYIKNHKSPTDNPAPMASMHDLFELFSYE